MFLRWSIENQSLVLKSSKDSIIPVDATSIFKSVFYDESIIVSGQSAPSIKQQIGHISFSKYPAIPCVSISKVDNEFFLNLSVQISSKHYPVGISTDQLIIDNKWYPIKQEELCNTANLVSHERIRFDSPLTLGDLIKLRQMSESGILDLFEDQIVDFDSVNNKPLTPCTSIKGLKANLYPYQQSGVSFLKLISEQSIGCILADEMGLGKTLQIIALLQHEKNTDNGVNLVVAPATLLENWKRELNIFAPTLTVLVHAGRDRPGISSKLKLYDVVLVSYETAIKDEPLLSSIDWNVLALDEAQNIKNPDSQRTIAVKEIPRRVSIAVTGTPLENKLDDLWSISDFSLQGLLGNLNTFREHFSDDFEDANKLAPIVAPIILRRKVLDVAKDLPEKIEIPQPILMTKHLAEAYESLRLSTIEEYGKAASMVATTKLRVLCAHPALCMDWSKDPAYEMPKYQRTLELLAEVFAKKEKVLVFTTYQKMVDIFMGDISKRWPQAYINFIDGRVAVTSRQTIIDDFFRHKGFGALFLNPKAAGAGLNITAANHVIHYNPEWNPALTEQASRRAYRRKQEKPVTIHHLYFANTLEEYVTETAQFKRDLAHNAVTGHDGEFSAITISEALNVSPVRHYIQDSI